MVPSRGDAYILHYRPRFRLGKLDEFCFKIKEKDTYIVFLNPIPPCFLASKCLNLIGRAETVLSNHTSFNKNLAFINGKHVYSK